MYVWVHVVSYRVRVRVGWVEVVWWGGGQREAREARKKVGGEGEDWGQRWRGARDKVRERGEEMEMAMTIQKGEGWTSSWWSKIVVYVTLKVTQHSQVDVELPLQIRTHLTLNLINLPEHEHPLANNAPGLVWVSVITDDLQGKHECRYI